MIARNLRTLAALIIFQAAEMDEGEELNVEALRTAWVALGAQIEMAEKGLDA